ncbi:LacI family DNA-binding transcriptional regulator [uncultured Friedmanniella sp.]|uniref:LacI family DNA-binding transcriptional regulator n=1 Tax=uncultured Friedmanniella sp. TaxID=335381 RepID=UPI0035C9C38E
MSRKATARDVADLAGVSRSAVSLVLNGRAAGNISAEKQRAVIAAAQQLRYTPNAVALSLRSQRTRTLGVLSWPGRARLAQVLLHTAWQRAHADHYLMLLMDTGGDPETERRQLDTLRDRQVDGFLIIAPDMTEYEPPDVLLSVPAVLLNCVDAHAALTSVVPDEVGAGRLAAEALLAHGHRTVGLLVGDEAAPQTRLRVRGVQQAFTAAGLSTPAPVDAGTAIDAGYRAARQLLLEPDRPTSLICTQERLAVGAVLAAADLHLSIPGALSVVSLEDGEELAGSLVPTLTTVHRPDAAMAEQAVDLLVERLAAEEPPEVRQLLFSCQLRTRSSVAVPASGR